jgi:hypothetical protein
MATRRHVLGFLAAATMIGIGFGITSTSLPAQAQGRDQLETPLMRVAFCESPQVSLAYNPREVFVVFIFSCKLRITLAVPSEENQWYPGDDERWMGVVAVVSPSDPPGVVSAKIRAAMELGAQAEDVHPNAIFWTEVQKGYMPGR